MKDSKRDIVYVLNTDSNDAAATSLSLTWGEGEQYFLKALDTVVEKVLEFYSKEQKRPAVIIYRDRTAYDIASEYQARFKGMLQEKLTAKGIPGCNVISASVCGSAANVVTIVQFEYLDYSEKEFLENIQAFDSASTTPPKEIEHNYIIYRIEGTTSVSIPEDQKTKTQEPPE